MDQKAGDSVSSVGGDGTSFQVQLLGPFTLRRDGVPVDTAKWQPRLASFLKLLANAPQYRLPRDELVAALWPHATPQAGRSNCRYLLHLLRRNLGGTEPPAVLAERGWIWLNPRYQWDIDLVRLRNGIRSSGDDVNLLEQAAALVGGEPLIENRYDDWAAPIRARIRRDWRDLCIRLGRLYRDQGSAAEAVRWLEPVLEEDELDEEAMGDLLRSLVDAGRGVDALRRYQRYQRLLGAELGVEPGPTLRTIMAGLGADLIGSPIARDPAPTRALNVRAVAPSLLRRATAPFVGREEEVAQVVGLVADGLLTRPQLVLLTAEAGMGKTSMLAEVARRARAAGALTLAGGCYEREGKLPYGPVRDALLDYVRSQPPEVLRDHLDGLLADVAGLVPEVGAKLGQAAASPPGGEDQRTRMFTGLVELLARIAREQILVLILDDLQWADDASLQLLHFLLRQDSVTNVLVLGAYRTAPDAADSSLAMLAYEAGEAGARTHALPLPPFAEAEMAALLAIELDGPCAASLVRLLHERSSGNPFFAVQMLALLRDESHLEYGADGWEIRGAASARLPAAVSKTVLGRLRYLKSDELNVLDLGAVLGHIFSFAALAELWGGSERDLFSALEALIAAGLLRETDDGHEFPQPVLREVVYQRLQVHQRRLLHRRAGLALEGLYGTRAEAHAAELAHHFVEGADAERAFRYAERAGDLADAVFAYDQAEQWYRAALKSIHIAGQPDAASTEREGRLLFKLGRVLCFSPDREGAISALEGAARIFRAMGDPINEGRALVNLAKTQARAGRGMEASEILAGVSRILPSIDREDASHKLVSFYCELATLQFRLGRYRDLLSAREREVAIAGALADERLLLRARTGRAVALSMLGRLPEAGRIASDLIGQAEALGDIQTLRLALAQVSEAAMVAGDFARSRGLRERELIVAGRMPGQAIRPFTLANLAQLQVFLGYWQAARQSAEQALNELLAVGSLAQAVYPRLFLGEIALREGNWEEADRHLVECVTIAERLGDLQAVRYAQRLLAERDIESGHPGCALQRLVPLLDRAEPHEHDMTYVLPTLAWAHLESGDVALGVRVAQDAILRATAQGNRLAHVDALRVRGMAMRGLGRWQAAWNDCNEAATMASAMPYRYAEGRALFERALIEAGQGEIVAAKEDLSRVITIFRDLGATKDARRAELAVAS